MRKFCGGDIVRLGVTRFATNYIAFDSLLRKKGQFKEIVYEWWMSTTQAKLDKNKTKSAEVNVRPSILGQSGKSNFIIWAIIWMLWLVDLKVVLTIPFVYELMQEMKETSFVYML